MPIVRECSRPDCRTLTMGELCLEHEVRPQLEPQRVVRHVALKPLLPLAAVAGAATGAFIRSRI